MNLKKSSSRGSSLEKYDPVNKVLFGQWNDNKVVSFISTLGVSKKVTVKRRIGSESVEFEIEEALKRYTRDNYMGGVDNVDKDKKIGGSFTKQAHFKKWYKMGLLGIFDFMVVNGRMAWNMSADDDHCQYRRFKLHNWKFRLILAEQMIAFKDELAVDLTREAELNSAIWNIAHSPAIIQNRHRRTCCVCQLEEGIQSRLRKTEEGKQQLIQALGVSSVDAIRSSVYNRKWLALCSDEACSIVAHHISIESDNLIFKRDEFLGLTCYQIAHHPIMNGLWTTNQCSKSINSAELGNKKRKPRVREVNTSHTMFLSLRNNYGLGSISRKKTRA